MDETPSPAATKKIILPKSGPERETLVKGYYERAILECVPLRSAEKKYGLPSNCLESYATNHDLPKPTKPGQAPTRGSCR